MARTSLKNHLLVALPFFFGALLHAQSIHLEAEGAQLEGPSLKVVAPVPAASGSRANYSGAGYVTGFDGPQDRLVFQFKVKQAGIYDLVVAYRCSRREHYEIAINGEGISGTLAPTTDTAFAGLAMGEAELAQGENSIAISHRWGDFDIDFIELTPAPAPARLAAVTTAPVDAKATPEARALLSRLEASYGKTSALGVYSDEDAAYVVTTTGLRPAIMGGDLRGYSPYFRAHESAEADEVDRLIADYQAGYTLTVCWHWGSPTGALDTKEKPWWRAFYTDSTSFDVSRAVDPTTPEHTVALADIDAIATQLRRFQDSNVPILWRPLHEGQGGWFWWGAKGPESYKQLWAMLYDRLVNVDGIHNLIWVFTAADDPAWYPGDGSVDVVGIDAYPENLHDPESGLWETLRKQFGDRKVLAINEFGGVPDIPRMQQFGEFWAYAVTWSNKYGTFGPQKNTPAEVKRIYTSPGVTTLPAPRPDPATAVPEAENRPRR